MYMKQCVALSTSYGNFTCKKIVQIGAVDRFKVLI